jgi:hypothetical protein
VAQNQTSPIFQYFLKIVVFLALSNLAHCPKMIKLGRLIKEWGAKRMSLLIMLGLSLLAIFVVLGATFAWVVRLASIEQGSGVPKNDEPELS